LLIESVEPEEINLLQILSTIDKSYYTIFIKIKCIIGFS